MIQPNKTAQHDHRPRHDGRWWRSSSVIAQNDKPRAEIVFDVEILEVNRDRVKKYGLNLSEYAVGGSSRRRSRRAWTPAAPGPGRRGRRHAHDGTGVDAAERRRVAAVFNLNTISRGISTADFYLAVPTAIVRFLESDTQTKCRQAAAARRRRHEADAEPRRGGAGLSTSYTPIATGGAGVNPLNSFSYRPVGINVDITPRVTLDGDILLELTLESSARGAERHRGRRRTYPSFGSRKVTTRLRLRDGESNLLAGLLREDERKSLNGFPGRDPRADPEAAVLEQRQDDRRRPTS